MAGQGLPARCARGPRRRGGAHRHKEAVRIGCKTAGAMEIGQGYPVARSHACDALVQRRHVCPDQRRGEELHDGRKRDVGEVEQHDAACGTQLSDHCVEIRLEFAGRRPRRRFVSTDADRGECRLEIERALGAGQRRGHPLLVAPLTERFRSSCGLAGGCEPCVDAVDVARGWRRIRCRSNRREPRSGRGMAVVVHRSEETARRAPHAAMPAGGRPPQVAAATACQRRADR